MAIADPPPARAASEARQLLRYCLVGASGYVVNLSCFSLLVLSGAPYRAALAVGFLISASSNYLLNRAWTFQAVRSPFASSYARFLAVSVGTLLANLCSASLLVDLGELSPLVAGALAIILATPIAFLLNRFWTFGSLRRTERKAASVAAEPRIVGAAE